MRRTPIASRHHWLQLQFIINSTSKSTRSSCISCTSRSCLLLVFCFVAFLVLRCFAFARSELLGSLIRSVLIKAKHLRFGYQCDCNCDRFILLIFFFFKYFSWKPTPSGRHCHQIAIRVFDCNRRTGEKSERFVLCELGFDARKTGFVNRKLQTKVRSVHQTEFENASAWAQRQRLCTSVVDFRWSSSGF